MKTIVMITLMAVGLGILIVKGLPTPEDILKKEGIITFCLVITLILVGILIKIW